MSSVCRYHWPAQAACLPDRPRAVALGVFDGLHIGHRAVIARAVGTVPQGQTHPLTATVVSLTDTAAVKADTDRLLLTPQQQQAVQQTLGVDEWIDADFPSLRDWSPQQFVDEFLVGTLHAQRVCCGFNFRFGRGAAGDAALLTTLCARHGVEVVVAEAVEADGEAVSSRRIRTLLKQGDIPLAARLIGRPYTLTAPVIHGQQLGRTLGYPTINQAWPNHTAAPRFGVYASVTDIDGRLYPGVTNVGVRPTVDGTTLLAETWIDGVSCDLYGRTLTVTLLWFLREEQTFASVEALQAQIDRDAAHATAVPPAGIHAVLFDFDDTLQHRSTAFLQYARGVFTRYAPWLSPDEIDRRAQDMLQRNNHGYVDYPVYFEQLRQRYADVPLPDAEAMKQDFQLLFPCFTTPFAQAETVLQELRQRGFKLGIITNGFALVQNRKLDYSGLRRWFDLIVVGGEEPVGKPHPLIFERAAARLGLPCDRCVFVGDYLPNDIRGAQAAGMQPVQAAITTAADAENVPVIRCLDELLTLLPPTAGGSLK